ncbi:MAG: hypothetical protein KGI50_07835 [Patescibacteria group bacterium]|nr:hypothetical protein [Patescibacteria group bacterium]
MKTSVIVTAPAVEPVSLQEAKDQLRIDSSDTTRDAEITRIITEARIWLENTYNISIITQTRQQRQDNFYNQYPIPIYQFSSMQMWYTRFPITLLKPPVQSVTLFQYLDTTGTLQTLNLNTDYVAAGMMPPVVGQQEIIVPRLSPVQFWPSQQWTPEAIFIKYVSGFGTDSTYVPQAIKRALLMVIAHFFENRVEETSERLGKFDFGIAKIMSSFEIFEQVRVYA